MSDQQYDPTAERAVLGSCIASPTALTDCGTLLDGTDFHDPKHELVWDAISALRVAGDPVDAITLASRMEQDGTLAGAGGRLYIADLHGAFTTSVNAVWHAQIVREAAARRRLVETGTRLAQLGQATGGTAADLVLMAQVELAAAYRPDPSDAKARIGDLLDDAIDAIEAGVADGIPWPWTDVNRVLNPASAGQLILIAARPAVGKSLVCVDVARHVAIRRHLPVVIHSLEMGSTEIIHRILAAEARVPLTHIKKNNLNADEWQRLAAARSALQDAPLFIIDNPAVGIPDIQASIARYSPAMVVLDYVQLAKTNPKLGRREGLEELTRGLKILAKTSGIPIVAAAQLKRGAETRVDQKPQMTDLRETGSLENDADVVILLHRPDQAEPECVRAGEMDFIIAKQRNGAQATVTLIHQLHYSRVVEAAA